MTTTTSTDVIRAALYARVSTTDQSLARQYEANRAAAAERGWLVTEYEDPGLSASRFAGRDGGANRAHWSRLLGDLAGGRIDVLVLWEPSRGDRQLTGWSELLDTCRRTGTLVHITSHGRTYDPADARDWRSLAEDGIDSAYESEKLSKRIKAGKDYWHSQGHPYGGAVPYGIKRINDPDRPRNRWLRDEPDPQTGPVARRIIRDIGAGVPLAALARTLTAEGIPTPGRSATWHPTTLVKMAENPAYVAAGVVTAEESAAARTRLARSKRTGERPARQEHRYSGCLACYKCGSPVRGVAQGNVRYRCRNGCVSMLAAPVDAWIDALAVERLSRPDLLVLVAVADAGSAARFWTEADQHRAAMAEAAASYAAGKLPLPVLEQVTTDLQARLDVAEAAARAAETPSALAGLPDENRAIVAERWDALTVSARRAALRALAPLAQLRPGTKGHASGGSGRHAAGTPIENRVVLWPDED
jgi:DNA invertase Pin-like site-specific DNA recombinase